MSLWPRAINISISNWPRRENSACYFKIQAGKTIVFYTGVFSVVTQRSSPTRKRDAFHFSHHSHALVTLYVQFLCCDWSKFDRWVHAENLCSILKLVYFWQLKLTEFCVNLWCFFYVFLHWMYKMKYSCYQESSVILGWFVYWVFGWKMQHLETCLLWQLKLTEFCVNLWCF